MHTSSDMSLEAYILEHQQVNYHFTPVLFTFYEAVQVKKAMTLSVFHLLQWLPLCDMTLVQFRHIQHVLLSHWKVKHHLGRNSIFWVMDPRHNIGTTRTPLSQYLVNKFNIYSASWNSSEAGHGKWAADGSGETKKCTADRLASTSCDLNDLHSFMKLIPKCLPRIKTFSIGT